MIQVLCIVAIVQSTVAIPVLAIVGLGYTAARLRMDLVLTLATILAMVALSPFHMPGLLGAVLLANLLVLPYQYRVVSHHLAIHPREILPALAFPLAANLVLALVLAVFVSSGADSLGNWPAFAIGFVLAALVPVAEILRRWLGREPTQRP